EIGKGELPHFRAIGIRSFVTIKHLLPAARDVVTRDENSLLGVPVTIHEFLDVAAVPRFLLRAQNLLNLRDDLVLIGFSDNRCRSKNCGKKKKSRESDRSDLH